MLSAFHIVINFIFIKTLLLLLLLLSLVNALQTKTTRETPIVTQVGFNSCCTKEDAWRWLGHLRDRKDSPKDLSFSEVILEECSLWIEYCQKTVKNAMIGHITKSLLEGRQTTPRLMKQQSFVSAGILCFTK